ncbi:MAG: hypothetical protein M3540_07080 [Actinomycetota bacterium]|nr:hypothetical protein [Actinomycetota bacterium]
MSGKTFTVRRGTTAIPNQTIYATYASIPDKDGNPQPLSIQALGLLLLLLSRPTGKASMGYRAMMGRGMGRVALLRALKELSLVGHLYRFKRRAPAGSIITDTVLAEAPITIQEAEEEWLAQVAQLRGAPVDNPEDHRASDFDATGAAKGATVRRFTGARSNGASSVPDAKVSLETSSTKETGENHAGEESGHHSLGSAVDNGATSEELGDGYAAYLAFKEGQRATRQPVGLQKDQKEVAPLRHDQEGAARISSPAHHTLEA